MDIPLLPMLVAGVVAIAGGLWFAFRGHGTVREDSRFVQRSHQAEAVVLGMRTRHDPTPADQDVDDWYFVPVVRFTLPDGRVVEAETMAGARPAPAREGEQVLVRYDPADPTRVNLAHGLAQPATVGGIHLALGIVFALMGVGALLLWVFIVLILRVPV